MLINYGCDVIKEVKVWWHQTIITCPLRHRVSLKKYNVTCYETQIHVIDIIIAFLYDPFYCHSIMIYLIFPWSNRYHICLSTHNASICLWLYWKLLRSNSFIFRFVSKSMTTIIFQHQRYLHCNESPTAIDPFAYVISYFMQYHVGNNNSKDYRSFLRYNFHT